MFFEDLLKLKSLLCKLSCGALWLKRTTPMTRFHWLLVPYVLAFPGLNVKNSSPRRLALSPELNTVHRLEALKADSLAIALHFVDVALGAETADGFTAKTAAKLSGLNELRLGGPGLITPPTPATEQQFADLVNRTEAFYAVLDSNIATVTWSSPVLPEVDTQKVALVESYDKLLDLYRSHLTQTGEAEATAERYAYDLMADTELIALHSALLLADVDPPAQREKMVAYEKRIESLRDSLLWGDVVHGVTDLSEVCGLNSMLEVSRSWLSLVGHVQPLRAQTAVVSDLAARSALAKTISEEAHDLRAKLDVFAVQLVEPSCSPSNMAAAGWKSGITETNKFRELVAACTRVFLQACRSFKRVF